VCVEQTVRSEEEKAACKARKEAKNVKSAEPKRKRGRPKGSKNKDKSGVIGMCQWFWTKKLKD
jgi:hypothetical protein